MIIGNSNCRSQDKVEPELKVDDEDILVPPKELRCWFMGRSSTAAFYQIRNVRVGIESIRRNDRMCHHLSFLGLLRKLNHEFCIEVAGKIGPGLDWKVDESLSTGPRSLHLLAEVVPNESGQYCQR